MTDENNRHSEMLISLVLNLQMSAMAGMGKIVNPATQKAERNMPEAKAAIDMLEMLSEKTKGNLTTDEDRLLQQVLTDLRLNYVNELSRPEPEKSDENDRRKEKENADSRDDKKSAGRIKKEKRK